MTLRERWLLAAGVVVLIAAAAWHLTRPAAHAASVHRSDPTQTDAFSPAEVGNFLTAAKRAETIADPLQRCLRYPDPPGSHWSRAVVDAYCHYRTQAVIPIAEVRSLIQTGHAAQLDHLLATALQLQRTQSASRGLLDRTYKEDFEDGSYAIRPLLDAWKRQSPDSAFAYAASGLAYVAMAQKARGNGFVDQTRQDQFDAMNRLLIPAISDLGRAVQLDPRVTPAYWGMIYAGGLGGGTRYAMAAAQHGLSVDPTDYSIYGQLLWLAQPKWAGSIKAMQWVTGRALPHAKANPLLSLLQPVEPATEAGLNNCACGAPMQLGKARQVLNQAAPYSLLRDVGTAASNAGQSGAGAIYLSEALRFNPAMVNVITLRSDDLADLGDTGWALAEASRAIALAPREAVPYETRAYIDEAMHDYQAEEQDCRTALAIDPDNTWTLKHLGMLYVYTTHEWDAGWSIASQMIAAHPNDPTGWILRASIQKDQPRSGEVDTIRYFLAHFGNDPTVQVTVAQMRARLARESKH